MEINNSNPLEELTEALNYFFEKTGNKITFEYVLLKNVNDSETDAYKLVNLCRQVPAFVNIIEFNKVEGLPYSKTSREQRDIFVNILRNNGVECKIRRSRGKDIDAACGQLANKFAMVGEN
jgi:23S rRNA (adenine2503-C2)-methyltransferase